MIPRSVVSAPYARGIDDPTPQSAEATSAPTTRSSGDSRSSVRHVVALAALVLAIASGCSGLSSKSDVVVKLEVEDPSAVQRVRHEVLTGAGTWGGTRVAEESTTPEEIALEFSLPGQNLDMAIGALDALDANRVETRIDVDPEQVDRTTTPPEGEDAEPADPVRLRVEVVEASGSSGSLGRMVLAIFSVIGMVATALWVLGLWRRRRDEMDVTMPRVRNIDRVDLREDPPTQETPQVPPGW